MPSYLQGLCRNLGWYSVGCARSQALARATRHLQNTRISPALYVLFVCFPPISSVKFSRVLLTRRTVIHTTCEHFGFACTFVLQTHKSGKDKYTCNPDLARSRNDVRQSSCQGRNPRARGPADWPRNVNKCHCDQQFSASLLD